MATEQKKTIIIELVDDVINKTNPFQNVSIEDTWIRKTTYLTKMIAKKQLKFQKKFKKKLIKTTPLLTLRYQHLIFLMTQMIK